MSTGELVHDRSGASYDRRWLYAVPVIIVVLDQLLKQMVSAWLGPSADSHRVDLLGDSIGLQYVENTGAAFGIMPDQTGLLTVVSIAISVFAVFVMRREMNQHPLTALAIGMVVGGAVGNIIDRLWHGFVVDFIAIGQFPKFNLADAMITLGIVLLLVSSVRDDRAAQRAEQGDTTDE